MTRARIDLTQQDGQPISTGQLAAVIGMSDDFIRLEIKNGELTARRVGRGLRREYRICWAEARRYCLRLGFLQATS
jgi:hypothetical protein